MHYLGPLGERSRVLVLPPRRFLIVCARLKARSFLFLALALVAEVAAALAQEVPPRRVPDSHPPSSRNPGADEPGALSPNVHGVHSKETSSFTSCHSPSSAPLWW